ncbi:methyltransferase [Candidatus Anaplasma sp. TIGMIC]|uniref:methyltransferase n=1 Tax=Candidatus Anaplasma sp. TIGMIC TaxID=3020713 RepID=UPI00232F25EE|nr:methyltransferase [Candidatus Anaplasma sp. TIGMIC]MDB1135492.1 methyltransferase domain-containing protein [Candidatus Anaplasma sp. TIGMIC]
MWKIFTCYGNGLWELLCRVSCAIPGIEEVGKLLKNGRVSIKESVSALREKTRYLLATNIDLGLYHFYRGNISDAKTRFWLIRLVRPGLPDVHYNIGRCYWVLKRDDKAIENFEKALAIDSAHKEARYYLDKIQAPGTITEVPENIIRQHYNYTSEYFVEHWLIEKNYRGHEYVRSLVMNFFGDRLADITILDLGCGTGACGQFLRMRDIGSYITGVDISRRMLDIARQCFVHGKRAYNELVCVSMSKFLEENARKYDVIVMTEVLLYFGSLEEILSSASKALSPTGMIIGLVRNKEGEGEYEFVKEGDFFCHTAAYIPRIVEKLGLHLNYITRCEIYMDKVVGLLFAISKSETKEAAG